MRLTFKIFIKKQIKAKTAIYILMSSTQLSSNTIQQKHISFEIPLLYYSPQSKYQWPTTAHNNRTKRNILYLFFSMDMECQMYVFWHYHYTLSMNGTQVGVLQEPHHVVFSGLLHCLDGGHLKVSISSLPSGMKQQLISIHGRLSKAPWFSVLLVSGWFILRIVFFKNGREV